MALTVGSDSIRDGERIAAEYAYLVPDGSGKAAPEGANKSPQLSWSGAPEGTQSFALACFDPDVPADFSDANQEGRTIDEDAPRQDFAHWLLVDISADTSELPEGAGSEGIVEGGKPTGPTEYGVTGANDYTGAMGSTHGGYDGPGPPWNDERLHHYKFTVYALDTPSVGLEGDFTLDDVRRAIDGHVLDQGEIVGTYTTHADRL